jgi:Tfp pilus assembly protein PilV
MKRKGLSLLEIVVSTTLLALVTTGLANLFVAGKRYIAHTRSRMAGGELGKYFLDPLQMYVKQTDWNNTKNDYVSDSPLHKCTDERGKQVILDRPYNSSYTVSVLPNFANDSAARKVKVDITWQE